MQPSKNSLAFSKKGALISLLVTLAAISFMATWQTTLISDGFEIATKVVQTLGARGSASRNDLPGDISLQLSLAEVSADSSNTDTSFVVSVKFDVEEAMILGENGGWTRIESADNPSSAAPFSLMIPDVSVVPESASPQYLPSEKMYEIEFVVKITEPGTHAAILQQLIVPSPATTSIGTRAPAILTELVEKDEIIDSAVVEVVVEPKKVTIASAMTSAGNITVALVGLLVMSTQLIGFYWKTKDRQVAQSKPRDSQPETKGAQNARTKQTILFLGTSPADQARLELTKEVREIDLAVTKAQARDQFELEQHHCVRTSDLQELLMRYRPEYVHISGHGKSDGQLIFEDIRGFSDPVPVDALSETFRLLKGEIRCVLLNTCYSETQARAIADHVETVIGMANKIQDPSAIVFSAAFYQAIAYGEDETSAFALACNAIDLREMKDDEVPQLIQISG